MGVKSSEKMLFPRYPAPGQSPYFPRCNPTTLGTIRCYSHDEQVLGPLPSRLSNEIINAATGFTANVSVTSNYHANLAAAKSARYCYNMLPLIVSNNCKVENVWKFSNVLEKVGAEL